MSLRDTLLRVDDRWLPGAAARARRVAGRLLLCWGALVAWWQRVRSSLEPAALDERWVRGPLARLRDRPKVAVVVVVTVLLAGVGVAAVDADGHSHTEAPAALPTLPVDLSGTTLGPSTGVNTTDYVRGATEGLLAALQGSPDKPRVALVSLTHYLTPEQVSTLLSGFTVSRALLHAQAAGAQAIPLPVDVLGSLLVALRKAYADTAQAQLKTQQTYQTYVNALTGTKVSAYRDLYEGYAKAAGIEAQSYAHNCACVFAVIVAATPKQLLQLRARPGVRAVEVAGPGRTLRDVQVLPLLPEVVGVVPRSGFGMHR